MPKSSRIRMSWIIDPRNMLKNTEQQITVIRLIIQR